MQSGLKPRMLFTNVSLVTFDCTFLSLPTANSTYGHSRRYLIWALFFSSGAKVFRFWSSSVLSDLSTGGRSGLMLMSSTRPRRNLALDSQRFLMPRSRKRMMIPESALRDRRWHAAKSDAVASAMSRCSRASLTHADRVSVSSSSAGPLRPWMVSDHFL